MSGICPEYVLKVYQNNNVHFRGIFRAYSEHPRVRNMFQNVIVSGHSFCPENIIVLDFSKLLLYWTVYGHFQNIFLIFSGHIFFSGHFQARIYLTRARIYQLTQARIKNLYLMVKFIHNDINIYNISSIYIKFKVLLN